MKSNIEKTHSSDLQTKSGGFEMILGGYIPLLIHTPGFKTEEIKNSDGTIE
jgi:hypothetical protein